MGTRVVTDPGVVGDLGNFQVVLGVLAGPALLVLPLAVVACLLEEELLVEHNQPAKAEAYLDD